MRGWAVAHAAIDFFQGAIPAAVPYFVIDRHYSYLAASGLSLAATLGASIPQPLFGLLVDRRDRLWHVPCGIVLAAIGAGAAAATSLYAATWVLLLVSGIGVAMFHPAAGRLARGAAGDSASAMSIFATGGNVGFVLAPALVTPALANLGLPAMLIFIAPACAVALVTARTGRVTVRTAAGGASTRRGEDQWRPFAFLAAAEMARAIMFFAASTFIELYWIRELHAGRTLAGVALGCLLGGACSAP